MIPCPARGVLARTAFCIPCGARGARRSLVDDFRTAPRCAFRRRASSRPPGVLRGRARRPHSLLRAPVVRTTHRGPPRVVRACASCSSRAPCGGGSRAFSPRRGPLQPSACRSGRVGPRGPSPGRLRKEFARAREDVCRTWGTCPARGVRRCVSCGVRVLSRGPCRASASPSRGWNPSDRRRAGKTSCGRKSSPGGLLHRHSILPHTRCSPQSWSPLSGTLSPVQTMSSSRAGRISRTARRDAVTRLLLCPPLSAAGTGRTSPPPEDL